MSLVSDRAAVQLALECASRIVAPATSHLDNMLVTEDLLDKAEKILLWHDKMCEARAKRDALRVNAPKQEYHPNINS